MVDISCLYNDEEVLNVHIGGKVELNDVRGIHDRVLTEMNQNPQYKLLHINMSKTESACNSAYLALGVLREKAVVNQKKEFQLTTCPIESLQEKLFGTSISDDEVHYVDRINQHQMQAKY